MITRIATGTLRHLDSRLSFSIAVPIRDHVEFLETALRSVESQNVAVEVAALDASDDDRAQQILTAHRVPVAYGYHRRDGGQAAAIHDGWAHTSGDIVAWLNVDDFYFRHALDRVAAVFEAQRDVDVVYGHAVHVSEDGDFLGYFPAIDTNPQSLTRGCSVCQPACFVRRRAIEQVGGVNTALHYTMDWDLWLRLHRAGCRFAFLDAPLAVVRIHAATKTMSRAPQRYREIAALLKGAGVSSTSRARTLAAFYRYDLQQRRSSAFDRVAYGLMSFIASLRRRTSSPLVVRGIECWTNQVHGRCRVELPWFGDASDASITVTTDRPVDLAFESGPRAGALATDGTVKLRHDGEDVQGHRYVGRVPIEDGTLSVSLSAERAPWRLLRMRAS